MEGKNKKRIVKSATKGPNMKDMKQFNGKLTALCITKQLQKRKTNMTVMNKHTSTYVLSRYIQKVAALNISERNNPIQTCVFSINTKLSSST